VNQRLALRPKYGPRGIIRHLSRKRSRHVLRRGAMAMASMAATALEHRATPSSIVLTLEARGRIQMRGGSDGANDGHGE
jgi:hypothetical protein